MGYKTGSVFRVHAEDLVCERACGALLCRGASAGNRCCRRLLLRQQLLLHGQELLLLLLLLRQRGCTGRRRRCSWRACRLAWGTAPSRATSGREGRRGTGRRLRLRSRLALLLLQQSLVAPGRYCLLLLLVLLQRGLLLRLRLRLGLLLRLRLLLRLLLRRGLLLQRGLAGRGLLRRGRGRGLAGRPRLLVADQRLLGPVIELRAKQAAHAFLEDSQRVQRCLV